MTNLLSYLSGKKTYLVGIMTFIVGGIEAANGAGLIGWTVPAWLYAMLGSLGLLALRAGVTKSGSGS
jgi:hypothetical protein